MAGPAIDPEAPSRLRARQEEIRDGGYRAMSVRELFEANIEFTRLWPPGSVEHLAIVAALENGKREEAASLLALYLEGARKSKARPRS